MAETYKPERRFEASLIAPRFKGYRNVEMILFKADPENNTDTIDFARAIKDYNTADEHKAYAEGYLKELFTWEEVEAMKEYFKDWKSGQTFNYHEVSFPIPHNIMCVGAIAVGGGDDFYMFSKSKDYPLNFKVWGYFDFSEYREWKAMLRDIGDLWMIDIARTRLKLAKRKCRK